MLLYLSDSSKYIRNGSSDLDYFKDKKFWEEKNWEKDMLEREFQYIKMCNNCAILK